MFQLHKRKAQSTVEYVLLVTAVILVILVVTKGAVTNKLTSTLNNTAEKIDSKVTDLDTAQHGTAPKDTSQHEARVKQNLSDNYLDVTNPNLKMP